MRWSSSAPLLPARFVRVLVAARFVSSSVLALVALVALVGCGGDVPEEVPVAEEEEAKLANPFSDLRPREGDVLVPPLIGFRWQWHPAGMLGEEGRQGLAEGEFRSSGDESGYGSSEVNELEAEGEDLSDGSSVGEGDPEEPEDRGAPHFRAAEGARLGDDGGLADDGVADEADEADEGVAGAADGADEGVAGAADGLLDLPSGHESTELERVDAYSDGDPRAATLAPPEDQLFRLVMVDSLGAIYARVVTTSTSVRVPLPPNTEPGPYLWYVELLSRVDSLAVGRSATETFSIR